MGCVAGGRPAGGGYEIDSSFNFDAQIDGRHYSLAFMMMGAGGVRAETVIGADGAPGAYCDGAYLPDSDCDGSDGGDGESVAAFGNTPTAIGGKGGDGGGGGVFGQDGNGGRRGIGVG
jgi:hypothetical protein